MAPLTLELGYSPCPNDTFMFHALVHGLVTVDGVRFEPWLADIEELNRRALSADPARRTPVTKISTAALALGSDRYASLATGAALGRGVGPLIVVRGSDPLVRSMGQLAGRRVAVPGVHTTAQLLLRTLAPPEAIPVEMRFDRILGAVVRGEVDAGVIIHEGRFTYAAHGLFCIADLGRVWEEQTDLPLALGVIAVDRRLPLGLCRAIERGIGESVRYAQLHPEASRDYVRAHAQEMDAAVCAQHIALYVNQFSVELGDEGRRALVGLVERARAVGFAPPGPTLFLDQA